MMHPIRIYLEKKIGMASRERVLTALIKSRRASAGHVKVLLLDVPALWHAQTGQS